MKKLLLTAIFAVASVIPAYAVLSDEAYDQAKLLSGLANTRWFITKFAMKDTKNKSDLAVFRDLQRKIGKAESSIAGSVGLSSPLSNSDYDKVVLLASLSRLHWFITHHALGDTTDKSKLATYSSLKEALEKASQSIGDSLGL